MSVLVLAPSVRTGEVFALRVPELFTSRPKVVTDGEGLRGLSPETLLVWVHDVDQDWNDRIYPSLVISEARVLRGSLDNVSGVRRSSNGAEQPQRDMDPDTSGVSTASQGPEPVERTGGGRSGQLGGLQQRDAGPAGGRR